MSDYAAARANLVNVVGRIIAALKAQQRDVREPGRRRKMEFERELSKSIQRLFARQAGRIRTALVEGHPERKSDPMDFEPGDDELISEIMIMLMDAARAGVDLFAGNINLGLDTTATNTEAIAWARKYAFDLVREINDTTRTALQEIIAGFAATPGMTIGDVMGLLPFDESRALRIATTEITRAYAQGNQLAGEALKEQYPDVLVVKHWFTNNDDRVCEICGPLDGQEVEIDETFADGIDNPPAHVGCRCWTQTGTRI